MKVALIHDHLAQDGGAEKVLKVLADLFPKAPIYTLLYEKKNTDKYFKGRHIETSIIQHLPCGIRHYQWYMPFMPMAVEFFDLTGYDLVISDSSSFAKGVITSSHTLHICYCYTPTRYLWSDTHQYINELKYNRYFKKIISLVLNYIRIWDKLAADRVDKYITSSDFVAKRIEKYYKRTATVINPPVDTTNFFISSDIGDYFLAGGRIVPYKRFDLIISAFKNSKKKLKIFGDGLDLKRLKQIANSSVNIEFLGRIDDRTKAELYSHCLAFINPQEEDFGITVIEAMASGRPVIAYNKGGVRETIIDDITGVLFNKQSPEALIEAIDKFEKIVFDSNMIQRHSGKYSVEKFKIEIIKTIDEEWEKFNATI